METKIDEKRMEKIRKSCGFGNRIDVGADGSRGGICLAWKATLGVRLKTFSSSHIDVLIKEENVDEVWRFTGFYGSPYRHNKDVSCFYPSLEYGSLGREETRQKQTSKRGWTGVWRMENE